MGVIASVAAVPNRSRTFALDWSLRNRAWWPAVGGVAGAATVVVPALLVALVTGGSPFYPMLELVGDPLVSAALLGIAVGCALEFGAPGLLASKRRRQVVAAAFVLNACSTVFARLPLSGVPLAPALALLLDVMLLRDHTHVVPAQRRKLLRISAALAGLYFAGRLAMYFMFTVVGFLMGFGLR